VYLLYYVCIAVFTLDAGLLARSQYSEGPATGHLDTGFSRFPCVYKQMLRWFPTFQVATTCSLSIHTHIWTYGSPCTHTYIHMNLWLTLYTHTHKHVFTKTHLRRHCACSVHGQMEVSHKACVPGAVCLTTHNTRLQTPWVQ